MGIARSRDAFRNAATNTLGNVFHPIGTAALSTRKIACRRKALADIANRRNPG